MKFLNLLFLVFCYLGAVAQSQYVHTPSISVDGENISFSYQGDIWSASVNGGVARRLTVHPSYESHPQWSSDGKKIVFQVNLKIVL